MTTALAPDRPGCDPRMEAQDREWQRPEREPTPFLVWSRKRRAWWGPHRMGYASCLDWAGRYTEAEARQIEAQSAHDPAHLRSVAVHEDAARAFQPEADQ